MALVTASGVSSLSLPLLMRTLVLPMTVARIPGGEFAGANGDTITVRVRQPRSSRTHTEGTTITYDDINEIGVNVTLAHIYDATLVSDAELSLELVDFGAQVTTPQVSSVAVGAENEVASAMNAVVAEGSFSAASPSSEDTETQILAAREALSNADVPAGDRFMAVSPEIASRVLSVDKFTRVDASGDDSALRNAVIGRLYGFTFVESNALDAGTAVAYHRSGFVMGNRVPLEPRGATESATARQGGIGIRSIFQYQPDKLSDASVLSTFAGSSVVEDARVFKLNTA